MKNPVPGRGPRGFTLIEMLVVLALMLVLVALGLPALQTALHQSKIRGIAQEVTVLMRLARIEAVKGPSRAVVQIVPQTAPGVLGHVRAFVDTNSDGRLDATETVLGDFTLSTGVTFVDSAGNVDKASVEGFSTDPDGGPAIAIFQRDGSIEKIGGFRFGDSNGNLLEVHVEPAATARIQVRKFETAKYVPGGDNGKAWTWN
jgi:prepilin-type N-terminal cleavage/methylation domain-containing protein